MAKVQAVQVYSGPAVQKAVQAPVRKRTTGILKVEAAAGLFLLVYVFNTCHLIMHEGPNKLRFHEMVIFIDFRK